MSEKQKTASDLKKILIIDDEQDICEVLSEFFQEYASAQTHFITKLPNAAAAPADAPAEKYDYIFLDLGIVKGEVDIKKFIEFLKEKHQAVVVTMTGQSFADSDLFKGDQYFYANAVDRITD